MKIAILYICTGKYEVFWKDFYLSCERHFVLEAEKHYFVFTDADTIEFEKENKNIHKIFQENLGWPNNTLKRYEVFLKAKEKILEFDYVFYLNANLLFLKQITAQEFLPSGNENLVACLHPGYFNKKRNKFTYETNPESLAFIPEGQGKYYFAGGINGGKSKNFIEAIEKISSNINTDLANKIVAKWHDESHWNRYLLDKSDVHILDPSYLYPEDSNLPLESKILVRNKEKLGGHSKFRGKLEMRLITNKLKKLILNIFKGIRLKTKIKIQGGLGNQMFQYAHGRKLEISGKKIIFDTSFFSGGKAKIDTARNFKLDKFNIGTKAPFSEKQNKYQVFLNKIKRRLGFEVEEFFQNEKYFKDIQNIIRKEFTLKKPLSDSSQEWENKIKNTPISVSLHIRRGDYVKDANTNAFHGVCGLDYYQKAFNELVKRVGKPFEIFIFSDDIDWAKENLKLNSPMHFISNPNIPDYEEMFLMSICNHNIIANSSFSWWGAWLNPNKEKVVIAPKNWFANKKENSKKITPEAWVKL